MNKSSSGGMSFASVLTIVFIVLKLTGVITWSWWWVLSPIWISFIIAVIAIFLFLLYVADKAYKNNNKWKKIGRTRK
jgi:Flp pilus assembly protein TadB